MTDHLLSTQLCKSQRSSTGAHDEKYQQSVRISACTENAGAEGFSNGPNPVDHPSDRCGDQAWTTARLA